ncbi:hypothetical protein OG585_50680 (plasmid) [Streptomyces sp. NBC_01340]|uniref:hypothetical protein n=1 Tax=Streptomyces sp. NBC_01340 TaxID=2903830 RepID=UPI002E0DA331|nr:hypothetical protein OG585_50680 [Streptomyces sp. NBC_01340]
MLSRLRGRALKRPFPPRTVLAECDLDVGRLIRLWDHTELTVVLEAAHPRPSHPGRIHRLEWDARQPARSEARHLLSDVRDTHHRRRPRAQVL